MCFQVLWTFDVPFTIGGVFHQLSVWVPVAPGSSDRAERFNYEQTVFSAVEVEAVNGSAGNDQVIPRAESYISKARLKYSGTFMDEHDLVGLAVFVKVTCHGTLRRRQRNMQFLIYQNRSEEHTSELQSLMRHAYAVFCLITKNMTN